MPEYISGTEMEGGQMAVFVWERTPQGQPNRRVARFYEPNAAQEAADYAAAKSHLERVVPPAVTPYERRLLEQMFGLHLLTASERGRQNEYAVRPLAGTADYDAMLDMQKRGLVTRGREIPGGLVYFHATDAGRQAVIATPTEVVP